MGCVRCHWRRAGAALLIGLILEFLIFCGVSIASPSSRVEPGSIDGQLFQWTHEPSFHLIVATAPLAPSFFDDLWNGYLTVAGLQGFIYILVIYLLIERVRTNKSGPADPRRL